MRMFSGWRAGTLAAALVAALGAFAQTPAENIIHVGISGLRNDKGQVCARCFRRRRRSQRKLIRRLRG